MGSEKKQILAVGLKESPAENSEFTADRIKAMVAAEVEKVDKLGFQLHSYFVTPSNPSTMDEIKSLLRSKQWDGVACGFGVRGTRDYTALFESVVNAFITEVQPHPPRVMFPVGPDDISNAIARVFPETK